MIENNHALSPQDPGSRQSASLTPGFNSIKATSSYTSTAAESTWTYPTSDATDIALLSHYISHTSRILALHEADYYVLQVHITNMAFRTPMVMEAVLAVSAMCTCHDMAKTLSTHNGDAEKTQLLSLFELGEQHYQKSLDPSNSIVPAEHVLASGIVLYHYAYIRQSTSVTLSRWAARAGVPLPMNLQCSMSDLIIMSRAAHNICDRFAHEPGITQSQSQSDSASPRSMMFCEMGPAPLHQLTVEDGPSDMTQRLFVPIIASTQVQALTKLQTRVKDLVGRVPESPGSLAHSCTHALYVLLEILQTAYGVEVSTELDRSVATDWNVPSPGTARLDELPDWLRSYLSRHRSDRGGKSVRAHVLSFVHRAPAAYIDFIIHNLQGTSHASSSTIDDTQVIAGDIFAHWLVYLMLLDGVWWIGDIGVWELEGLSACMCASGYREEDDWWPANMFRIKRSISNSAGRE